MLVKLSLILSGSWFAFWNWRGLEENPQAVWHFVVLVMILVIIGLWGFCKIFDYVATPARTSRQEEIDFEF